MAAERELEDGTAADRIPDDGVRAPSARPETGRSWQPAFLSGALILLLTGLCVTFWLRQRPEPLPVLGTIPAFHLTDQTGASFDSASLRGKVWVANFIFTACGSSCPQMTKEMRALQDRLPGRPALSGRVSLISFSVDPTRDTPDVLARYADHYGADAAWWRFLTGTAEDAVLLSQKGFQLPAAGSGPGGIPTHSDRFGLVDRQGRLRGHYRPLSDAGDRERLLEDVERLVEDEESGSAAGATLP